MANTHIALPGSSAATLRRAHFEQQGGRHD